MSWSLMSLGAGAFALLSTAAPEPDLVLSTRAVIIPGQSAASGNLPPPPCAKGTAFHVHAITAVPELQIGATGRDVTSLGKWAASVWLLQPLPNGSQSVALSAFAEGAQLAQASLPGGQRLAGGAVAVTLVGLPSAPARYEFNIHVSGRCGPA